MSRVTCNLSISADGYSAGHDQSENRPFGDDGGDGWGDRLHAWMFDNPEENRTGLDQMTDARAYVMGRNMFGPVRGEWDRQWNGWWGDDPPFHAPVFVLTHHPRDPQPMDGGTTYHFVTEGIESALAQAREAAGVGEVSIHGGACTINQYLAAGLIDELRLHILPITLGSGTRLFDGVRPLNLEQVDSRAASSVTHVTYRSCPESKGGVARTLVDAVSVNSPKALVTMTVPAMVVKSQVAASMVPSCTPPGPPGSEKAGAPQVLPFDPPPPPPPATISRDSDAACPDTVRTSDARRYPGVKHRRR